MWSIGNTVFCHILKFLWQLPQHLLALSLIHIFDLIKYNSAYVSDTDIPGFTAVSLGQYRLYFQKRYVENAVVVKHETGHSRQSLYLGWLYLIVIGLPSLVGNIVHRFVKFDYYEQPWEKWADKLGGVDRSGVM